MGDGAMNKARSVRRVVFATIIVLASIFAVFQVSAQIDEPRHASPYMTYVLSWLPMLLLIGLWIYFMRVIRGGQSKSLSHLDKSGQHMAEVAKQLERIANALERRNE